ncbi:hypothetical protein ONZ45_g13416 [Pleurotus djamor]|nr:hypothetical protein ONZ45_g13416 [Pleurotus djamor]
MKSPLDDEFSNTSEDVAGGVESICSVYQTIYPWISPSQVYETVCGGQDSEDELPPECRKIENRFPGQNRRYADPPIWYARVNTPHARCSSDFAFLGRDLDGMTGKLVSLDRVSKTSLRHRSHKLEYWTHHHTRVRAKWTTEFTKMPKLQKTYQGRRRDDEWSMLMICPPMLDTSMATLQGRKRSIST